MRKALTETHNCICKQWLKQWHSRLYCYFVSSAHLQHNFVWTWLLLSPGAPVSQSCPQVSEINISSKMLMRQCPRLDHRRAHPGPGKNQTKCGRSACLCCGSHAPTDVLRKQLLSLCIGFLFLKWGWFAKVAIFPLIISEFSFERPRLDNAQRGPNPTLGLMSLCLAVCVCFL